MVTYRASRLINAPIKYVYDWATDYTEEDNSIWGGKYQRIILAKTKTKCVYASYKDGSDGKPKLAVRIVTLRPSKYSWHLDYFAEEDTEVGDYKLTKLGDKRTRLDMVFKNRWKHGKGPPVRVFVKEAENVWEKYTFALEKDYNSGKSPRS